MKDLIISMSWLNKAVLMGLGSVMFPLLMTTLCQKGIKPEVLLAWYMVGATVGIFVLSVCGGSGLVTDDYRDFFVHTKIIIFITLLGATFGVAMNTFYGQAIQGAPNPALPISIINSSVVMVYVLAPLLNKIIPSLFPAATISWTGLGGVILTLIGIIMIVKSK